MKTNYPTASWLPRSLGRAVSASALLLLGFAAMGQVVPKSPLGTWDCVMSGPREGLAQITFLGDGTFVNTEVLVPKAPNVSVFNPNERSDFNDIGRTPGINTNTSSGLPPHTDLFGWGNTTGPWGFDSRGRVIGYFYEADSDVTNAVSFVAIVVPGKRLTLLASTPAGTVTFRGVPDLLLPDLSGSWYGVKKAGLLWYNEFYTLTPSSLGANIYEVQGGGPAYTYSGIAIAVPQKKMAIGLGISPVSGPPDSVRAVVGSLNSRTFSGALHGLESVEATAGSTPTVPQRFHFTAQRQ